MVNLRLILLLLCGLCVCGAQIKIDAQAAGMNSERLAAIPIRMREFVDQGQTAGMVTIVARHGHVASFDAVGYQDLETKQPMRRDSLFRIASLTKPVTCAAIMLLVDEGWVSLIDPVEKYLPEYKNLTMSSCAIRSGYACQSIAPSRAVNLEDLMTHTSGLPASGGVLAADAHSLADLVKRGPRTELLFEPGTHWSYSNLGIDILGRIVEIVSKQPFDRFLHDRIFSPLEMADTSFVVPPEKRERVAALYTYSETGLKKVAAEWGAAVIPSPAGGLVSSASDMLRFNEMMRAHGIGAGGRILSSAAVDLMTLSHTGDLKAGWSPGVGHGYGYEVIREPAGMFRYSSLGTYAKGGAYRTFEWVDPTKDLVGILMMQRTNGGGDTAAEINAFVAMSAAAIEK
jgi:CubicO group peptidase (beta-lactamase class C family)